MAVRIQFRRGTAAEWAAANPTLGAGEAGYETDTAKFKLGTGNTVWNSLSYAGVNQSDIQNAVNAVIDGAPNALNTLNEIAFALNDDSSFANTIINSLSTHTSATTNVHGIANTALLITTTQFDLHTSDTTDVHGIANTALLATLTDATNAASSAVSTHSADTTDVHGIANTALLVTQSTLDGQISTLETNKAPKDAPTFTGNVVLPSTTSIGEVSSIEIGYLNNVSSAIQTQLDGKLATSVAATTYAALTGATFTGNVVLTANTTIGTVDSTELGYLNGITSSVQNQLDAKAPTANPTFTGTVAGVTKSHVGLGSVDNTADADKPVSTATQTALDAKLNLAGGTLTGYLTLSGAPTSDLHAATKLYVDGLAAGINFHQPVVAATSGNLAGTYDNGTSGVGATLTKASNGAIGTIDGASVSVGSRILLRAQTDAKENGVYTVTAVGSVSAPWVVTRATDADNNPSGEIATGDFTFVTSGSTNGSKGFIMSTTGTITIGTTEINYSQFNASEAVIAGTNIDKTGETISVVSNPTFANVVTASSGVAFSDGTQTKVGVPSITTIDARTASYTLSALTERDSIIEISNASATTLTIPLNSSVAYPVGTTIDIIQTGAGQVTIGNAVGVTVNATPGLKLRTQWSSATLLKRATNTWLVYGDLTA
jgi:hypothetical protein